MEANSDTNKKTALNSDAEEVYPDDTDINYSEAAKDTIKGTVFCYDFV